MGDTGYPPGVSGRSVGQSVWYQISHAIQVRRFIHLGDVHSKQWAAICGIQVTIYGYPVAAGEDRLQPETSYPKDRLTINFPKYTSIYMFFCDFILLLIFISSFSVYTYIKLISHFIV